MTDPATFLIGLIIFSGIGAYFAKDYIQTLISNTGDDYEESDGQRTKIRHEGGL